MKKNKSTIGCCKECYKERLDWQKDNFYYPADYVCFRHLEKMRKTFKEIVK
jgi:hypothetical protein